MNKISSIFIAIVLLNGIPSEIFAAGTPAGTVIHSRSRAVYTTASGAQSDTVYSTVVSITVRQIASMNLTPVNNAVNSQSDSTVVDYPAVITNSGNGTDAGMLAATSSRGWTVEVFADVNSDGVLQPAEQSAGPISQTAPLAADAAAHVIVRIRIPRDESLDGTNDTTRIVVTSDFDAAKSSSGDFVTTVRTANLASVAGGLSVSNPAPNAGTTVVYTLEFSNNGSRPADNVLVRNLVPDGLTIISTSGSQGSINSSGVPIEWNVGTMPPSATVTLTTTAQVNESVVPGTIISNHKMLTYSVGVNSYSTASNAVQITVGGILSYGVQLTPFVERMNREAGDTAIYRFSVRNAGSFTDVIELSHASSRNLSWSYYKDANNNSMLDESDPLMVNTNAAGGVDSDSLSAGDSLRIFIRAIIPRVENDLMKDSLQITGASAGDPLKRDTAIVVTTILSPEVMLSKNIFPIGDQPAGSVMTYTISYTNNGSVSVKNFSVIDVTPASTEYVPNSVKVNGVAVNDNTGGVSIVDDPSDKKIISVNIGTLNAQSNGSVEFKVKIK